MLLGLVLVIALASLARAAAQPCSALGISLDFGSAPLRQCTLTTLTVLSPTPDVVAAFVRSGLGPASWRTTARPLTLANVAPFASTIELVNGVQELALPLPADGPVDAMLFFPAQSDLTVGPAAEGDACEVLDVPTAARAANATTCARCDFSSLTNSAVATASAPSPSAVSAVSASSSVMPTSAPSLSSIGSLTSVTLTDTPTIVAEPVATFAASRSGAKPARTAGIAVAVVIGLALLALGLGIAVARRHSLVRRPRAKGAESTPVVYFGNLSKGDKDGFADEKGDIEASEFESTPIEQRPVDHASKRGSTATVKRHSVASVYPSTPAQTAQAAPPSPPPQPLLSAARSSFQSSAGHSNWTQSPMPAVGLESPITPFTAADERDWELRLSGAISQAAAMDWADAPPLPEGRARA